MGKQILASTRDGTWYLDMNGDGAFGAGDKKASFGQAGWSPVVGNWNGDGKTDIGVYKGGTWYLDMNSDGKFNGPTSTTSTLNNIHSITHGYVSERRGILGSWVHPSNQMEVLWKCGILCQD